MDEEELQSQLLAEFRDYKLNSENETGEKDQENKKSGKFGALILISFIWIQGIRSDSNLIYVPREQQIYCGNGENKSYDALRFRCYAPNCQAKIYLRKNGTAVSEPYNRHNHGTMYYKYKEMECINNMKKMCMMAPASTTTREIYDQAVLEYVFLKNY